MAKILLLSVLTIPLFFHLSCANILSDRRLDDNNVNLSNKDGRHGKPLIVDNERRMTTKFDAKIRSKNNDLNVGGGRMEERAKLLRSIENQWYAHRDVQREDARDRRREERVRRVDREIHPGRSSLRQGERRVKNEENEVSRVENNDARAQDAEKRFESRELRDGNDRRDDLVSRRTSDEKRSRSESTREAGRMDRKVNEMSQVDGIGEKRRLENERSDYSDGRKQNQDQRLRIVERQNNAQDERRVRSQLRSAEERAIDNSRRDVEGRVTIERENTNRISDIVRNNAAARTRFSNKNKRSEDQERGTADVSIRSFAREERNRNEREDDSEQTIRDGAIETRRREEARDLVNINDIRQELRLRDQLRKDMERNEDVSRRKADDVRGERKGIERISKLVRNNAEERSQYNRRLHGMSKDVEARDNRNTFTRSTRDARYRNERNYISPQPETTERNNNERISDSNVSEEQSTRVEERRYRVSSRANAGQNDGSLRRESLREERDQRTYVERISAIVRNNVKERSNFNSRQNRRATESQDRRELRLESRVSGDEHARRNDRRLTDRRMEDREEDNDHIRTERQIMQERRNMDRVSNEVRRNVRARSNNRIDTRRSDDQDVRNEDGNFRENETSYDEKRIELLREATRRERQNSGRRLDSRILETRNRFTEENRYRDNMRVDALRREREAVVESRREMRNSKREIDTISGRDEREETGSTRSLQGTRENERYIQGSRIRRGEDRRSELVRTKREDIWKNTLRMLKSEEDGRDGRRLDNKVNNERNDNTRRAELRSARNERQLEERHVDQASRIRLNERQDRRQERNNRDDERINREGNRNEQSRRVLGRYNINFDNNDRRNVDSDNQRSTIEERRQELSSRRRIESEERTQERKNRNDERIIREDNRNEQSRHVLERYNWNLDDNDRRNVNLDNERSSTERRRQEVNSRRRIESEETRQERNNRDDERSNREDNRNEQRGRVLERYNNDLDNHDQRNENLENGRSSIERRRQEVKSGRRIEADERSEETRRRIIERRRSEDSRNDNRSPEIRRKNQRVSRDNRLSDRRIRLETIEEMRNIRREERIGGGKHARHDISRREVRDTPRIVNRDDNLDRRVDRTSRFETNRNQERGVERQHENEQENRCDDRRMDTKDIRQTTRKGILESRKDFQGEDNIKRNDVRELQNKGRDDLSNARRADEVQISGSFRNTDAITINPKYADNAIFLSNDPDCFLNIRSLMKLGHSMIENVDTTLFTQVLLGGVTMALMWNKKQIHGSF